MATLELDNDNDNDGDNIYYSNESSGNLNESFVFGQDAGKDSSYNFSFQDLTHSQERLHTSSGNLRPRHSQSSDPASNSSRLLPHSLLPFGSRRQQEFSDLHAAVERISMEWMENPNEVVWITASQPGLGKTQLLKQAIKNQSAFFKAMVCQTNAAPSSFSHPFRVIHDLLHPLIEYLLPSKQIWKHRLEEALGGEGPLVATVCPKLSELMDLSTTTSFNMAFDANTPLRFQRLSFAIRDVLQAISEYHPLVWIVDDFQYTDLDSLALIQDLCTTKRFANFLWIGAYEELNEPEQPTQTPLPWQATVQFMQEFAETPITTIPLQPFSKEELVQTLRELFVEEDQQENVLELAEVLHILSHGNPLWACQLLKLLQDTKWITHNLSAASWEWNRKKIKKEIKRWKEEGLSCYDSLQGVVQARLEALPRKILFVVMVLGHLQFTLFPNELIVDDVESFYRVFVAAAYSKTKSEKGNKDPISSKDELQKMIQKAIQYGILKKVPGGIAFTHEVIRQAAGQLVSPFWHPAKRPTTGTTTAANSSLDPKKVQIWRLKMCLYMGTELSNLFVTKATAMKQAVNPREVAKFERLRETYKLLAVGLLPMCSSVMDEAEKAKLAKIHLEVAEIAMARTAIQTAVAYLEKGVQAVDHTLRWQPPQYDTTLRLFLFLARMRLCCGRHAAAKAACEEIFDHCTSVKDRVDANQVLTILLQQQGKHDAAMERLLDILKRLGEVFPPMDNPDSLKDIVEREIQKLCKMVSKIPNQELLSPKKQIDKKAMDVLMVLANLVELSRNAKTKNCYHEFAMIRMMRMSLEGGFTRQYPLAFSLFAVALVQRGKIKEAHRMGQVAEKIARLSDFYGGEAVTLFHWHVSHWRRTYKRNLEPVLQIYNAQVDSGDFMHVGFSISTYMQYHLVSGYDLVKLADNIQLFLELHDDYELKDDWVIEIPQEAVSALMGETSSPLIFFGQTLAEQDTKLESLRRSGKPQAIEYLHLLRLFVSFFFNDYEIMAECFEKLVSPIQGVWIPWVDFMECFLLIQTLPDTKGKKRRELKEKIEALRGRLVDWYNEGAPNPNAMISILEAEFVLGKEGPKGGVSAMKAQGLFKEAVEAAERDGATHLAAFACERAAAYFDQMGVAGFRAEYLAKAHKAYDHCQYIAKAIDLETRFGDLLEAPERPASYATGYRERNASKHQTGNNKIGGGQGEIKTVNVAKGFKKAIKKVGIKKTSRKVRGMFKREKAEPLWASKRQMALDESGEAPPEEALRSPMHKPRFFGRGTSAKNLDGNGNLTFSPSPDAAPKKVISSRLFFGKGKKGYKDPLEEGSDEDAKKDVGPPFSASERDEDDETEDVTTRSPKSKGDRRLKADYHPGMEAPLDSADGNDEEVEEEEEEERKLTDCGEQQRHKTSKKKGKKEKKEKDNKKSKNTNKED